MVFHKTIQWWRSAKVMLQQDRKMYKETSSLHQDVHQIEDARHEQTRIMRHKNIPTVMDYPLTYEELCAAKAMLKPKKASGQDGKPVLYRLLEYLDILHLMLKIKHIHAIHVICFITLYICFSSLLCLLWIIDNNTFAFINYVIYLILHLHIVYEHIEQS